MSHPAGSLDALGPEAIARAWSFEPIVVVPVAAAAALYLCGWATMRRQLPDRFGAGRATAFVTGLGAVLLALCSPLDALGHRLLQAHMIQHLLLMVVAPPLIWLGAPVAPLLVGLPRRVRRVVASALASRPVRRLTGVLAEPRVAWVAFVVVFWAWHAPPLYDLALRSDVWHHVEHACFFLSALAFWRPVILPWPARPIWPRWAMIVYLLLAEAQATLLSAILTFSDRVIYRAYDVTPGLGTLSALEDQSLAGVIMWVPGSVAFTIALVCLVFQALGPQSRSPARAAPAATTAATATNGSTATSVGQRS
jgi:cytochrome c oxidase assembly factor CtaG